MAFTGVPVIEQIADGICRITGVSLAAGATGTIGLAQRTVPGEVSLPAGFKPEPYHFSGGALVPLTSSIDVSVNSAGAGGAGGGGGAAMFFGFTAGTGNPGGTDYAATVAVGAAVPFPQNGPDNSSLIARTSATQFQVTTAGLYKVSWAVDFLEASQLVIAVNAVARANTNTTSGAGTQQNTNTVILDLAALDVITLINPAGNAAALTVQTADGTLTHAQAPSLVIEPVSAASAGGFGAPAITKAGGTPQTFLATIDNTTGVASSALEIYVKFHE